MNWICKLGIALACSLAVALSAVPSDAARSVSSTTKKAVAASQSSSTKKRSTVVRKKTTQVVKKASPTVAGKAGRQAQQARSVDVPSARSKRVAKKFRRSSARGEQAVAARDDDRQLTAERPLAVSEPGIDGLAARITARSAMIMDAATGEALYAQAADTPRQPASTIKVLTGVISLDALRKDDLVPVSQKAAMMPKSKVFLQPGRKYPANDLINALLLASANDASVALAERIAGSEQAFARLMTAKARSFGATNTVCKTASGLTAEGQYTTARDLARIFTNAMRQPAFANKMGVTELANADGSIVKSHNRALWQVDGAEGGKTGFTNVARRTYVGKFKRGSDEIVVAMMGSDTMWSDVKKLVEYGFSLKRSGQGMATRATGKDASTNRIVQLGGQPRQLRQASSL